MTKMQIVIVAGGLATRMQPIAEKIPKCLIDINGKPLIQHQLEFFKKKGYTDIIFCIAHLAEKVKEYFKDGTEFGLNIQYSNEEKELMGTAGAVKQAEPLIEGDFIVFNGDNLTSMDFDRFVEFHKQSGGLATMVVRPLPERYKSSSVIILNEDKRINVFLEKPPMEVIEKYKDQKRYINSGIYLLNKDTLELIPKKTKFDFSKQFFPLLMGKQALYGYPTTEFFREIGRIEKYVKLLKEFKGVKEILK